MNTTPNRYRFKVVRLAMLWERLLDSHNYQCSCGNINTHPDYYKRLAAVDIALTKWVG